MRRILLLITDLQLGGTPTVVRELAVRLAELSHVHVEVACLAGNAAVAHQLRRAGLTVTTLDAKGKRDVAVVRRLANLIRQRKFDTVFSFLIHANVAATLACSGLSKVLLIHSIHTTQARPRWHWWAQALITRSARRVIVPTKSVLEALRDRSGVDPERIAVIPNAVQAQAFEQSQVSLAPGDLFPVGFIGRLDPIKRIADLIEAVAHLGSRVTLQIFGEGEDRPAIEAAIKRHCVADRVHLAGSIARAQDALSQIALLVLPSDAEGFGIVLIEAMAAGVPVVATNVDGIRDVVRDGITGILIPPRDPPALAAAIRRIIDNVALREKLIRAGKAEVKERFSWDTVFQQYRQLLDV